MSDPIPTPAPDDEPDQAPAAGTAEPQTSTEQGGAPRTDVASAPALQERDAAGGDPLT